MRNLSRSADRSSEPIVVQAATGRVRTGGRAIAMQGREREFVVALALQAGPVPGAALGLLLNPDWTEPNAANNAKVYVHRLRATVASDFVVRRDGGYVFGPRVRIDVVEGRELLDRLSRSRITVAQQEREPMIELARQLRSDAPHALREREWFDTAAIGLRRLGHDLVMLIARDALANGDVRDALAVARELTYEEPCDEEAWELFIRALMLLGEHPAAVQGYRFYEASLAKELQARPSAHLRRLLGEAAYGGAHAVAV